MSVVVPEPGQAAAEPRPEDKRVPTRFPVLPSIADRWSPRSFSDRPVEPEKLRTLFEAARLAPSAHNNQPARFLATRKGVGDDHARLAACLNPHNDWAERAPVLILAGVTRKRFSQATAEWVAYPHCTHDLGLAVMSLMLQAQSVGLSTHPLAGFEPDQARAAFAVPELYELMLIIAVGYRGPADRLPPHLRSREVGPRVRRPVEDFVFEGTWGDPSNLFAGAGETRPVDPQRTA